MGTTANTAAIYVRRSSADERDADDAGPLGAPGWTTIGGAELTVFLDFGFCAPLSVAGPQIHTTPN